MQQDQGKYRTIKIHNFTHPKLKMVAGATGESIIDFIERMVEAEAKRLNIFKKARGK